MPLRPRIVACLLGAWLGGTAPPTPAAEFTFAHEHVLGTSLELRVRSDDDASARSAESAALAEIARLADLLSNHDPASAFRRWQAAPRGPVPIAPELLDVLAAAERWRIASGGAFDSRAHLLGRVWSEAARRGTPPTDGELAAATRGLDAPPWRLDPTRGTAERLTEAPLTLDAIAKGFLVGRAADAAMAAGPGVRGVLLNVGGDLRARGDAPWTVGVVSPFRDSETAEPLTSLEVREAAVATSGRSQRGFDVAGRRYSHILDPRTGRPAEGVAGATVVAPDSADADALATILNVLDPEDGLRLVASVPGAECLIVAADGRAFRSAGLARLERPAALAVADEPAGGATWGDTFELAVGFEINRPPREEGDGPYRRPYVAVWVEDEAGAPVRTLILWVSQGGAGPFQWIPDLKRWYRADQARKKFDRRDMVITMSRPTRAPGRYSVTWDGKDDRGRPVKPGRYVLAIDAAREHGTYQNIRTTVDLGETPFTRDLQGNVEIRSATVEYRRKGPAK